MAYISPINASGSLAGLTAGDISDMLIIRENNTRQVVDGLERGIIAALEEIGLRAQRYAFQNETAVDTGRLHNSITHQLDAGEKAVYIGTNVEYAPYIELGHHSYKGLKFLTRAASEHSSEYRDVVKKHLGG